MCESMESMIGLTLHELRSDIKVFNLNPFESITCHHPKLHRFSSSGTAGVACHLMSYPYAVFYCHRLADSKVFKVSLEAENGDKVKVIATSHMDTSTWNPDHVSFKYLGVKLGTPVYYFFHAIDLMYPLFYPTNDVAIND